MKPRLLIRALCVGAALLVPAGGLSVLGVGTAGATTTTTVTPSSATLGTLGTMTMSGIRCPANIGTNQCNITSQLPITRSGVHVLTALPTFKMLLTIKAGPVFHNVTIKAGGSVTIKGSQFSGCIILTFPKLAFTISGLLANSPATSLANVTVKGCPTATVTALKAALHSSDITVKLQF
jgi:hypothetical protein